METSILKATETHVEALRQNKTTKNEDIIPINITYNPKYPSIFPIIEKASIKHFNTFTGRNLLNPMNQVPNLGSLLCRSKLQLHIKNNDVRNSKRNCFSYRYLLKAFLH